HNHMVSSIAVLFAAKGATLCRGHANGSEEASRDPECFYILRRAGRGEVHADVPALHCGYALETPGSLLEHKQSICRDVLQMNIFGTLPSKPHQPAGICIG